MSDAETFRVKGRVLAIDYGAKRVGLALSDPMQIIATPYKTIPNDEILIQTLLTIIKEEEVSAVILGDPMNDEGSAGDVRKKIFEFKAQLETAIGKEVALWDERFSSSIASERIIQSVKGKHKRRDKSLIDKNAAAVILEEYLASLS